MILVKQGPGTASGIKEGWMFVGLKSLLDDSREVINSWRLLNHHDIEVPADGILVYLQGDVQGDSDMSMWKLERQEISGYGADLLRYVWQAPRLGNMRAGVTVNLSSWSSYPPHAFEREGAPDGFEEVFVFFAKRDNIWPYPVYGLVVEQSNALFVSDGSSVRITPGLHAVGAMPGCKIGYVWAYTAEGEIPEKPIRDGKYEEDL